jgi:hypothetical protein
MTYRSFARALSALGLAGLASLAITPARAANIGVTGLTIQAASAGVAALTELFAPRGAMTTWSAKASNGRHARPKGGRSLH